MVGPNAAVWKGGISKNNPRYQLTHELTAWSQAVLKRDKYKCRKCGAEKPLQAHHIKSFAHYPKLRLKLSNGLTLCVPCHEKIHGGKGLNRHGKVCPHCKGNKSKSAIICIRCVKGNKHHRSVLTEEIVIAARKDRMVGLSWLQISKKYNIHPSTTRRACVGFTWAHVK